MLLHEKLVGPVNDAGTSHGIDNVIFIATAITNIVLILLLVIPPTSPGGRVPYLNSNSLVCIVFVAVVIPHHHPHLMLEEGMMTECQDRLGGGGTMAVTTVPISVIVVLVPCVT